MLPLDVEPAHPEELTAAFRLVFQQAPAEDREARVSNALTLVREGVLDPAGVWVARGTTGVCGAFVCLPVPGASALVWPPQAVANELQAEVEDQLVRQAGAWLRQRGAKLAQALLLSNEADLAKPLERNGFRHVTSLCYLRHTLDLSTLLLPAAERLIYQTYPHADRELFHQILLQTYEGTQDCPEINGVRSLNEVITGHQAQGVHDPDRWWLARDQDRPVGVLLLTEVPEWAGWDVSYVGVVPEARRRGFGRELMHKALFEARAAEVSQLTLSVDARNLPAWILYRALGFEPFERREVYLAIWTT